MGEASIEAQRASVALLGSYEGGTDIEGRTPLMRAAALGQGDVVEVLLGAGMCLDAVTHQGRSALHFAAEGKRDFHLPVVQVRGLGLGLGLGLGRGWFRLGPRSLSVIALIPMGPTRHCSERASP